mmetsp:Transcript_13452/g.32049  ORF Transcript_13452/g.32049 Transcript_13452/m.32049 type:complete len:363 (-) Transcript_13452:1629-2717(-)
MGRCCGVGSVDSGFWLQAERRLQAEDLSRLDRGIELELGGEEAGLVEGLELVDADLLGALLELPLSDAHLLVLEPQHVLGARVLHLVADHHAQDVQQQLVVVLGVVQVRVERAAQRALHAILLGGDERVQHNADREVHVVISYHLAEVHAREGLGHADHALNVAHCDRDPAARLALSPQLRVQLRHFVLVDVADARVDVLLGVDHVLLQHRLCDRTLPVLAAYPLVLIHWRILRVASAVRLDHELCERSVQDGIDGVLDDAEHVEAREDRLRQLHVLVEVQRRVVAPSPRVRGRDHCAPRLEGGDDASLGDGDALLLHRLVDRRAVLVAHLVKLIDETHAGVCQYKRSALERPFARDRVHVD